MNDFANFEFSSSYSMNIEIERYFFLKKNNLKFLSQKKLKRPHVHEGSDLNK
jgi:hypothetical protein